MEWNTHTDKICAKASTQLKRAGLAVDQKHHFYHFYLPGVGPILEYCTVVSNHGLTKAQVEQLEAIQRRAIRIIFEVTFNLPYQFALAYANISSLQARRKQLSKKFFKKIMNNPNNPLFHLLLTPTSTGYYYIGGRLRSAHPQGPVPKTRTARYGSFIHHPLTNYQPKLK